jgi:erythromycin esterase-like protein
MFWAVTEREYAQAAVEAVRRFAVTMRGEHGDLDPLLSQVGQARFVLIGEASHGTHEFYCLRAELTQRLVEEHGFGAVAVEADWPDAYRVDRFVRGLGDDAGAVEALAGFQGFPGWMWRNADVLDFVGWLREHNDGRAPAARVGFYGLDLYSLYSSMAAVISYLDRLDPQAANRARRRYACFDHAGDDGQAYGVAAGLDLAASCEEAVVEELRELRRRAVESTVLSEEEHFAAVENARVARDAEAYYRTMFRGRRSSWNLRDTHMADTLEALVAHLDRQGGQTKVVVWAHNTHVADARATEMGKAGELSLGQLVRQRLGDAFVIGFSTHAGTVTAASSWDGPAERKLLRPALPDSYEALFHATGLPRFALGLRGDNRAVELLRAQRLERAIGVIYLPESERVSHYFRAVLPEQFDAVIHVDHSRAVEPLERIGEWHRGDLPETFPTAV